MWTPFKKNNEPLWLERVKMWPCMSFQMKSFGTLFYFTCFCFRHAQNVFPKKNMNEMFPETNVHSKTQTFVVVSQCFIKQTLMEAWSELYVTALPQTKRRVGGVPIEIFSVCPVHGCARAWCCCCSSEHYPWSSSEDWVGVQICVHLVQRLFHWHLSNHLDFARCMHCSSERWCQANNQLDCPFTHLPYNLSWTQLTAIALHWCVSFCLWTGHRLGIVLSTFSVATPPLAAWSIPSFVISSDEDTNVSLSGLGTMNFSLGTSYDCICKTSLLQTTDLRGRCRGIWLGTHSGRWARNCVVRNFSAEEFCIQSLATKLSWTKLDLQNLVIQQVTHSSQLELHWNLQWHEIVARAVVLGKESSLQKVDFLDSQAVWLMGDLQRCGLETDAACAGWPFGERDGCAWATKPPPPSMLECHRCCSLRITMSSWVTVVSTDGTLGVWVHEEQPSQSSIFSQVLDACN